MAVEGTVVSLVPWQLPCHRGGWKGGARHSACLKEERKQARDGGRPSEELYRSAGTQRTPKGCTCKRESNNEANGIRMDAA